VLFKIIKLLARRAARACSLYYFYYSSSYTTRVPARPRPRSAPRTEVLHAFRHCVRRSEALSNMQTHVH
jgi:hypothetical protein